MTVFWGVNFVLFVRKSKYVRIIGNIDFCGTSKVSGSMVWLHQTEISGHVKHEINMTQIHKQKPKSICLQATRSNHTRIQYALTYFATHPSWWSSMHFFFEPSNFTIPSIYLTLKAAFWALAQPLVAHFFKKKQLTQNAYNLTYVQGSISLAGRKTVEKRWPWAAWPMGMPYGMFLTKKNARAKLVALKKRHPKTSGVDVVGMTKTNIGKRTTAEL